MIRLILILLALPIALTSGGCSRDGKDAAASLASQAAMDQADGRYEEAFQKLERAVALKPEVAEYHTGLGMVAVHLERRDVALEQHQSSERILATQAQADPERVDDHVMVLQLLGRPAEARQALSNGMARFPDSKTLQQLDSAFDSLLAGFCDYAITNVEPGGENALRGGQSR